MSEAGSAKLGDRKVSDSESIKGRISWANGIGDGGQQRNPLDFLEVRL